MKDPAPLDIPLQVTFHGLDHSDAVEELVREKARKLWKLYRRIVSCRVAIEKPHRHQVPGSEPYRVRIDLTVPGDEIVVAKDHAEDEEMTDVGMAVRHAFTVAERRVKSWVARHRPTEGRITHAVPDHGLVVKIFGESGFGFVEMPDGTEVFFHRNAVVGNGFKKLNIGDEVRVAVQDGEKGPQASTVDPVGKDGRHAFPRDRRRTAGGAPVTGEEGLEQEALRPEDLPQG